MPFCRECGKEVKSDWVTCPFCSQDIGPPASNTIGLQDSVVMGDVSINDASSTKCVNCGSMGAIQISCSKCKGLAYCNICESEVKNKRREFFVVGRNEQQSDGRAEEYEFLDSILKDRECKDCFTKKRNTWKYCDECEHFFHPSPFFNTCYRCGFEGCSKCFQKRIPLVSVVTDVEHLFEGEVSGWDPKFPGDGELIHYDPNMLMKDLNLPSKHVTICSEHVDGLVKGDEDYEPRKFGPYKWKAGH